MTRDYRDFVLREFADGRRYELASGDDTELTGMTEDDVAALRQALMPDGYTLTIGPSGGARLTHDKTSDWYVECDNETFRFGYRDIEVGVIWLDDASLTVAGLGQFDNEMAEELADDGVATIEYSHVDEIDIVLDKHVVAIDAAHSRAAGLRQYTVEKWQAAVMAGETALGFTDWREMWIATDIEKENAS